MTLTADQQRAAAKDAYASYLAECPSRQVLDILGAKWATLVLLPLEEGPQRHSQLRARVAGASQKMLTETLRLLERDGLVAREVKQVYPAHVEYSLTALGESLMPIVHHMKVWADANMAEVEWHRRAAES
ncbi:HxlR family transcriptional regulator [Agromyces sp. Root1464]|uniref:winged helix-turn-helix transcriptional regulator n=1 Tax=Agromyces sp. Root1464 TaxID=1736467 RepID=UPI0006F8675D|nr:helix-turn-helix domain-containing protein [Agromyces sp. Root1464]KQZ11273.1 HxlR family transcriptional regulator [Agromyces sp. Root1464]